MPTSRSTSTTPATEHGGTIVAPRASVLGTILLLLGCLVAFPARATLVAPHALFMDHRTRSAVFYVHNPSENPAEVSVELRYGYPTSGEDGGVRLALFDNPAPDEPSAAAWVKALPRRVTVPPGGRQAIRLLARPPAGLPDGEYWSRVLVTSQEVKAPTPLESDGAVQVGLNLATRTITSLNYRKGDVRTGVRLRSLSTQLHVDAVQVDVDLARVGNAAFLGTLEIALYDGENRPLDRWQRSIAVYHELARGLRFPLRTPIASGNYRVELRLTTARSDLPADVVLPAEEIFRSQVLRFDAPLQP